MIHKNRGNRRKTDWSKAIRKQEIVHNQHDYWRYPSLGYFRKGKIHCSCPLCSAKTGKSPYYGTNYRYGKGNYKISDIKKIDSMNYQMAE